MEEGLKPPGTKCASPAPGRDSYFVRKDDPGSCTWQTRGATGALVLFCRAALLEGKDDGSLRGFYVSCTFGDGGWQGMAIFIKGTKVEVHG